MEIPTTPRIMKLLSRYTYGQKFIVVCIIFLISLFIAGYYMVQAQNAAIYFAQRELKGNIYQRGLRNLMEAIPKHQWLANQYLAGNIEAKQDLFNLSSDITINFKYLAEIDQELQSEISINHNDLQLKSNIATTPSELNDKWEDLIGKLPTLSLEASSALHGQILENIHKLLHHVGETANLILDPTIEANYFMETILFELPQTQLLIPKMVVLEQQLLNKDKDTVTKKDNETMMILASFLQANLETTKTSLQKGFTHAKNNRLDNEIETKLKLPLYQYLDSTNAFLKYTHNKILIDKQTAKESEYISLAGKALEDSFKLWDDTIDQFDKILQERIKAYKRQQYFSIAAAFFCALIGILLGILIMREISRPLNDLINTAKRISDGDLSARVPIYYQDEVGQVGIAFNQMADSFKELIGGLKWTGEQLTNSTNEIATAAEEQEATVVQQERTTKEIALTAQEISSTAKELAKTMNDLSVASEQSSAFASSGKDGLNRMEIIMRQMVEASQNIATKLAVLSEKAGNFTGVITTITKVADQTNLLSLNAAIEAEKAGEHGRTFAVIAREIRRLADQTGNATLDIEQTVNEIISAVAAGVMSVDKFSEEIHTGVKHVNGVSEQLSKIIEQVQQQTSSFENVNKGMQAQSVGAEQINESITLLTDVAQHASDSIRQFNSAVEQLTGVAHEMGAIVSKIKR